MILLVGGVKIRRIPLINFLSSENTTPLPPEPPTTSDSFVRKRSLDISPLPWMFDGTHLV